MACEPVGDEWVATRLLAAGERAINSGAPQTAVRLLERAVASRTTRPRCDSRSGARTGWPAGSTRRPRRSARSWPTVGPAATGGTRTGDRAGVERAGTGGGRHARAGDRRCRRTRTSDDCCSPLSSGWRCCSTSSSSTRRTGSRARRRVDRGDRSRASPARVARAHPGADRDAAGERGGGAADRALSGGARPGEGRPRPICSRSWRSSCWPRDKTSTRALARTPRRRGGGGRRRDRARARRAGSGPGPSLSRALPAARALLTQGARAGDAGLELRKDPGRRHARCDAHRGGRTRRSGADAVRPRLRGRPAAGVRSGDDAAPRPDAAAQRAAPPRRSRRGRRCARDAPVATRPRRRRSDGRGRSRMAGGG